MSAGNGTRIKLLKYRRAHRWLGKTIVVFVVFLALSGIVINHSGDMGLDRRYVSWSWLLDAYGLAAPAPTASFVAGDRRVTLLGGRLFLDGAEVSEALPSLGGAVTVGPLLAIGGGTRVLVLLETGDLVEAIDLAPLLAGDIDRVGLSGNRVVLDAGGTRYRSDPDVALFETWQASGPESVAWSDATPPGDDELAVLEAAWRGRGITVERLLLDLHSGRIFGLLGKLLLDLVAVIMIVLSVSGLILAGLRARNGNR